MDLDEPIVSVIPSLHGRVLAVLARVDVPLSGRQVTELIDGRASRRGVDGVLQALVVAGIVQQERHPGLHLFRLNRRHLAAAAIVGLASMRDELLRRMSAELDGWSPAPVAAWLFGSAARGDGSSESDVDVFLLRPDGLDPDQASWDEQVTAFTRVVSEWTGNDCRVVEHSEAEFGGMVQRRERLVDELQKDAIRLTGAAVASYTRPRAVAAHRAPVTRQVKGQGGGRGDGAQ